VRNAYQKWIEYEGYIDDLMREYALNKSHMSAPEKESIVSTIMKTEESIDRLKRTIVAVRKQQQK
jgi:hypothetical protein